MRRNFLVPGEYHMVSVRNIRTVHFDFGQFEFRERKWDLGKSIGIFYNVYISWYWSIYLKKKNISQMILALPDSCILRPLEISSESLQQAPFHSTQVWSLRSRKNRCHFLEVIHKGPNHSQNQLGEKIEEDNLNLWTRGRYTIWCIFTPGHLDSP